MLSQVCHYFHQMLVAFQAATTLQRALQIFKNSSVRAYLWICSLLHIHPQCLLGDSHPIFTSQMPALTLCSTLHTQRLPHIHVHWGNKQVPSPLGVQHWTQRAATMTRKNTDFLFSILNFFNKSMTLLCLQSSLPTCLYPMYMFVVHIIWKSFYSSVLRHLFTLRFMCMVNGLCLTCQSVCPCITYACQYPLLQ